MQSGGYEGDGSNLSSSATPGGTSSGDDGSGKRRRMTFGGSGINSSTNASSSLAALPHQPASARLPPSDYVGSMGPPQLTAQPSQRSSQVAGQTQQKSPITPATARSLAASASAAATAAESSHAALARHRRVYSGDVHGSGGPILTSENNHGSPTGGDHAMDAHLGDLSNISPHNAFSRSTSFATQNTPSWLASGSRPVLNTSGSIGGPAHPSIQGHAASHPPGLGSQVLRGPDRASIGHNAATDFTRRKGWSARVVEELLDMVHVLDDEARFLYATPGIFQMTGWRAEELRGMPLWNYVHPEDVEDVKREFARMSTGKADMTCYYRFRRKPQTAADKRQKRADIELATAAGDSPSTSGVDSRGDSSSAEPASQRGPNRARRGASSTGSPDEDDTEEHWEIFETTGHAYVPPKPLQIDANGELNHDEIDKMLTDNLGEDGATSETNAGEKAGAGAQESPSSSSKVQYYFCSARVYPTKNVAMLDSFLELKLENERLRLLLADMDLKDGERMARRSSSRYNATDMDLKDGERMARRSSSRYNASEGHLDERKSGTDGQSQGRASLDDAAYHPDFFYKAELEAAADHRRESASSMNGAAWRRESGSDFAGHKSQPTSPPLGSNTIGNTPSSTMQRTLTSGTGVAEESEEDDDGDLGGTEDGSRKKKKPKGDEGDYVCTDCGRIDSPEWRKGPLGPKTLCNACGLRWAKKVKRSGGDPTAISNAAAKTPSKKSQAAAARAAAHAHRHAHQSTGIDIGMGVLMGQASQTATAHGAMNQIPAFMRDHSSQHLSTIQQHDMSPQHGTDLMNAHH
ncbi:GATA-4/5/6 transcription factors [Ceraceosorus bombacis]|uniref:GATA-4/5/6 transcription factors n=1 Tax=Ceraceosorus bombacis TaxID=401625 RepID=A0A0P1BMV4_9BASI|nr:GATA-4/5/6 transcription factors [Ceraceosorus bombacis]